MNRQQYLQQRAGNVQGFGLALPPQRTAEPDPRTKHGNPPRKFTFVLPDRRPKRQLDLGNALLNMFGLYTYFAHERIPMIVRLCPVGLREVRQLPMLTLRRLMWEHYWIHPDTPLIFVPKAPRLR